MNQQRYNQRRAIVPLPPPSNSHDPSLNVSSRAEEEISIAIPNQAEEREGPSRSHQSTQTTAENPQELREKLEQACHGFFKGIVILQIMAFAFFLPLTFVTQILKDNLDPVVFCCSAFAVMNIVFRFIFVVTRKMPVTQRLIMVYKIIEAGVILAMFGLWVSKQSPTHVLIPVYILLGSFLIRMIYSYKTGHIKDNKFANTINRTLLLLKMLILAQAILALVQLFLGKPMSWFVALIPAWISIIVLIAFTANLFRDIYYVCDSELWEGNTRAKKLAAIWIFGNLIVLIGLTLCISLLVAIVYDGYLAESSTPFLAPFIVVLVWCAISLEVAYSIGDVEVKNFMRDVGLALEAERNEQDVIKYVIKISNTFFKPATKRDIKQLNSKKPASKSKIANDPEVQACLRRMPTESVKCMICCSNLSDGVFMECGHGAICFECGTQIKNTKKECHMCRSKIENLLKIDMNVNNTKAVYYKIVKGTIKK